MDARRAFNGSVTGSVSRTPEQRRARSGSFMAQVEAVQDGVTVGTMEIKHSQTARVTTVSNILNLKPAEMKGVGEAMFRRAEHVGRQFGATELHTTLTAPEAQGFYRKMGLQPDPATVALYREAAPDLSDEAIARKVPVWKKAL